MASLLQDLRQGVRLLRRTPGFAAVAILVLALAIGVNTAVFSVVNTLILQPRPGRIDQTVSVFNRDRNRPDSYRDFSYPAYVDLRSRDDVFESLMAHMFTLVGIADGEVTKQSFAALTSSNYFTTLGVPLAAGRAFAAAEERPGTNARVVIASYGAWRRAGLDPGFVGKTVRINGSEFTIVGVAPRGFSGTMTLFSPEWWFPLGSYDIVVNETFKVSDAGFDDRRNYALNLVGILKPGVSPAAAEQALDGLALRLSTEYPTTDRDRAYALGEVPRTSVSSSPQKTRPAKVLSALLLLMSMLVLVVACLNLANLLLARGAARRREIAIRQALGSGRRRIVQQLLVEGFVLSACGAAAGLLVGAWTSGALLAWLARALPLGLQLVVAPSLRLVPAAAAFGLFSTLCFALGPAWALARRTVTADLKGELGSTARLSRRFGVGALLVVGQLAVSLALVASGGLFVRGAINAANVDPGFAIDRHLIVSIDPSLAGHDPIRTRAFYREALARVRSLPGVEHASAAAMVPFGEFEEGRSIRLRPGDDSIPAEFNVVGADYFATIGMKVLRGREFNAGDEEGGPGVKTVVIDKLLADRVFKDADAVGRSILVQGREGGATQPYVVVGVVASGMRHDAFDISPKAHVFLPTGAVYRPSLTIHVRTAGGLSETTVLGNVVRELKRLDPALPILSALTMTDHRYRSLSEWAMRAAATMFSTFGALALFLATIGVYGLRAYEVTRKTREIGIRIALGATAGDVTRLVLGESARATVVALAIGVLIAAGLGKLAGGMLYQVSPFDPVVISTAAAVLAGAAMLASYLPARRATRIAPLDALRTE